ncbi:aminotransferase class V-fold PLP-dependent enzyme [Aquisalimonas lutea]|uniref:aminotransferase class V-fold PLP-dependent enzyme n=1 Tax=Aquisalimonas lutea TaxID=1327750 RepID=UPI0025B57472|nr:aminotransferase class V-fold PLP-dependent enzyme [Aquisalimonas lutea]MDN3518482.1 aminotransferase class V-fold PLP-dependent enzyme [Aquisalimonas lutea]
MAHSQFPQDADVVYLNHAGVGAWPRRTADAVAAFARENAQRGAARYPQWLETEKLLRQRLADLVNAPSVDDIALVKNTSEALSLIAYGLDWAPGDEVVINRREFPSNRIVWESLQDQGVVVRDVDLGDGETPEDALITALGPRTRLLAVSAVQYGDGLRMDLDRLSGACREHGVLFCVDAIQQLGALRFDLQALDADFVVADGHKWLLGPEGLGLFYCRADLRGQLRLTQYGWHMVADAGNYDTVAWEPAATARRFECGSPNLLGVHGLEASLAVLQDDVGMAAVEAGVLANARHLLSRLESSSLLHVVSDPSADRLSGIVVFAAPGVDSKALYRGLMAEGIICAARGGGVRFSPHFYLEPAQLDYAVERAEALAANLRASA